MAIALDMTKVGRMAVMPPILSTKTIMTKAIKKAISKVVMQQN